MDLLEKENVLWMLAAVCQNVHDFWDDLESADPWCDSLRHMKAHGIDQDMVNQTKLAQLRLLDELIVTRAVDMFGIYLSEMLQLVFQQEPRILRSAAQMRVDEILAYDSMDDLVREITRRRVDDLARKGFFSILVFIKDTLGVEIKLPEKTLAGVTLAIAIRNIIVHNGGRVNERFVTLTNRSDVQLGLQYPFSPAEVMSWRADLEHVAEAIDISLVKKFRLETVGATPRKRRRAPDDIRSGCPIPHGEPN
jgi:hypothetical protein